MVGVVGSEQAGQFCSIGVSMEDDAQLEPRLGPERPPPSHMSQASLCTAPGRMARAGSTTKTRRWNLWVRLMPAGCPLLLVISFQKNAIDFSPFREEGRHLLLCLIS